MRLVADRQTVTVQVVDQAVEIRAGAEAVLRYRFAADLWKPYVQSLRLPGGPELLTDAPADHPHHHGLWFGHGRVEAGGEQHDLWLERPGRGRLVHTGLTLGPDGFTATADWLAADGRPLARDRRAFRIVLGSGDLTLHIDYTLEGEGVRLHGSNEAGLPHLRPAPWIAARGGGSVRDSEGRRGEKEIFGQSAAWVDYSGPAGGLRILDHPGNLGRPTRWFVRDYGPFSPNDGFFDPEPRALPLHLRYAVVAHP